MNDVEGKAIAGGSRHNRDRMTPEIACGCYHCQALFLARDVREWVDDGKTALCPRCGVDAVLPDVTDATALRDLHERWFSQSYQPFGAEWDTQPDVPRH